MYALNPSPDLLFSINHANIDNTILDRRMHFTMTVYYTGNLDLVLPIVKKLF